METKEEKENKNHESCCNSLSEIPTHPFTLSTKDLWRACERATVGGWLVGLTSRLFLATKQLSGALPSTLRPFLLPPLRKISAALGLHLSRAMLVACECAVETALAMTMSPAAEWLRQSQPAPLIQVRKASHVSLFLYLYLCPSTSAVHVPLPPL
jgi:hypothetical protein